MRIEQFEYLLEISKNKSMNAASKKLHITPQALSSSIKKLEDELKLTILERTTKGVTLTEDGRSLLYLIENFLSGLKELQGEAPIEKTPICGPMRLLVPQGFTETYLPELLKTIYADYPEIEVIATPHCYTDIIELVSNGSEEYGLTYKIYINGEDIVQDIPDQLKFTALYKEKFYCTIPNNFAIAKYKSISLKTILDYPIIMYEPGSYLLIKILEHAGKPSHIINVPSLLTYRELLKNGLGVGFAMFNINKQFPVISTENNLQFVGFKENVTGEFGYIVRKEHTLSNDSLLQIKYLTNFFQK